MRLPGDDTFCKEFRRLDQYKNIYEYILDSTVISFITNHRDQKVPFMSVGLEKVPVMFDYGFA